MNNKNKKYLILLYDNTLDGLLSAIFDVYRLKLQHFDIIPAINFKKKLFQPTLKIVTNKSKANRIKIGLKRKTKQNLLPYLHLHFDHSIQREAHIYALIQKTFSTKTIASTPHHIANT